MERAFGFAQQGAQHVWTMGYHSHNVVQETFPFARITVYMTGTTNLATIFHDNHTPPTPLANPFTANENGWWWFYAVDGRYDVMITPRTTPDCPWTIGDIYLGTGGAGGTGNVYVSSTAPASPQSGQLWFDTQNISLNIWYGNAWLQLLPGEGGGGGGGGGSGGTANIYIGSSSPVSPEPGQLWFDSQNISLNIWYSGAWLQLVPGGNGGGGGGGGSITAGEVALNPPVGSWTTVQQAITALYGCCVYVGPAPPASAQPGQLWFDSENVSLNIRFSNAWLQL
jgi:hypothetical protein